MASNRLSTATFYGASLGLECAVYGDPMEFQAKTGFNGEDLLEHTFAEMHGEKIDPAVARRIADRELGRDQMMSPAELRLALGWQQTWRNRADDLEGVLV